MPNLAKMNDPRYAAIPGGIWWKAGAWGNMYGSVRLKRCRKVRVARPNPEVMRDPFEDVTEVIDDVWDANANAAVAALVTPEPSNTDDEQALAAAFVGSTTVADLAAAPTIVAIAGSNSTAIMLDTPALVETEESTLRDHIQAMEAGLVDLAQQLEGAGVLHKMRLIKNRKNLRDRLRRARIKLEKMTAETSAI